MANEYFKLIKECYTAENGYNFSSKLSHEMLYGQAAKQFGLKYIQYPSVAYKKLYNNVFGEKRKYTPMRNYAFHPDFFDEQYELKEVSLLRFPTDLELQLQNIVAFGQIVLPVLKLGHPETKSIESAVRLRSIDANLLREFNSRSGWARNIAKLR